MAENDRLPRNKMVMRPSLLSCIIELPNVHLLMLHMQFAEPGHQGDCILLVVGILSSSFRFYGNDQAYKMSYPHFAVCFLNTYLYLPYFSTYLSLV